jgi:hypothetical protein
MHRRRDLNRFWPLGALLLPSDRSHAGGSSAPGDVAYHYQAAP